MGIPCFVIYKGQKYTKEEFQSFIEENGSDLHSHYFNEIKPNVQNQESEGSQAWEITQIFPTEKEAPDNIKDRFGRTRTTDNDILLGNKPDNQGQILDKTLLGTTKDGKKVYVVNGKYVRDNIDSDFGQGGNYMAYPEYIPKDEYWLEKGMEGEFPDILKHEHAEAQLMEKEGMKYSTDKGDGAHDIVKRGEDASRGEGIGKEKALMPKEIELLKKAGISVTGDAIDNLELTNEPIRAQPDQGGRVEQPQENPEITPNKAISATQEGGGIVTPPLPEKPVGTTENAPEGQEREKSLLNRFHNAKNVSEDFVKGIKAKGLTYESISNDITAQEVDYLIGEKGLDWLEKTVLDKNSTIEPRIQTLSATRLVRALDVLADMAERESDFGAESDYRDRSIALADAIDEKARSWGRGIQELASEEVMEALSPKTHVRMAQKMIRGQRDNRITENRPDIDKKAETLWTENEKAIDEALKSKIYQKTKDGVTGQKGQPTKKPNVSREKIVKEQNYRKPQWEALKRTLTKPSGLPSVTAIGLSAEQINIITNLVGSYVREGYYRTEELIAKLKNDWKKYLNEDKSDDEIRAMLPEKVEGKPLADLQQEGESMEASTKLANRVMRMLQDPKTPKDDPVKQMVDTLFGKVKEKDTKEKQPTPKKTDAEKIKEAIENKDEYKDVWEQAKNEIGDKINRDKSLSEAQKTEYGERLDGFYNEVIGKPFNEKQVEGATKATMKDLGVAIDKVIRDHYAVYDATKRTIQEKLIDELNLSGDDAKLLSDAIGSEFDKIATERKRSALKKGITAKEIVHPKTTKLLHDKLIELTNLGAFSDAEFSEAYADKWGFPKLEPEQVKEIERLARAVQDAPEGFQKFERIQDLLSYQTTLKGIDKGELAMSLWYSSILSGFRTQAKNIVQNTFNSVAEWGVSSIYALMHGNPQDVYRITEGMVRGYGDGWRQAKHIMQTGYNPIRGYKIEVPNVQERYTAKGGNFNPVNWGKYVTRWMVAADAFTYGALKEMRSYELAMNMAREINKNAIEPSMSDWKKAQEILGRTSDQIRESEAQAKQEGFSGNDFKRRAWELMEQKRGKTIIEDATHFAAHGTFNYAPEGVLGYLTESIGKATQDLVWKTKIPLTDKIVSIFPAKFVIPFTRIIGNVANMALDYYPITGLARATTGGIGMKGMAERSQTKQFYRQYTPEERFKEVIKAGMGMAAIGAIYALTDPDKDGKSKWEVTANGYGDYQKNYELKELGWQPYSIRIGKKWYSYQYTPLIMALAPLGYYRDMQKYHKDSFDEDRIISNISTSMFKGVQVMNDMTWAATLNSLMQATSAKEPGQTDAYFKSLVTSTAKSFIYPKLAEQLVQTYDGLLKNPRHDNKTLLGKIFRDIPIVRNKYNIMLNDVGEPINYDIIQMIGNVKDDPFHEYLTDKNLTVGKPNQKATYYDDVNKIVRSMTNDEYYDFVRKTGPEIKQRVTDEIITKKLPEDEVSKQFINIKAEIRKNYETELFSWGDLRTKHPDDWKLMRDNGALQTPVTNIEIPVGKEKESFGTKKKMPSEQLKEFNTLAMEEYRKRVIRFLANIDAVKTQKERINPETNKSVFEKRIDDLWANSKDRAKKMMSRELRQSPLKEK